MIDVNELRKGVTFEFDDQIWKVLDYSHNKPGRGNATIRNSFASTEFTTIARNLTITSNNGTVRGSGVGGSATLTGSFAAVDVRDIGGPTKISNNNGNVTATDIRNDLTVDTRFGLLRAERIRGSLDAENGNGGVTASEVGGNARVRTSFASVFLKGVAGTVTVDNANGSIMVSGLRGACNDISLKTSFASIKLGVPSSGGYNVDARTSFGSITTDVPILVTQKSEGSLVGTINNGGCRMTLVDNNGNITIGRE